jgi:hypothetical protein
MSMHDAGCSGTTILRVRYNILVVLLLDVGGTLVRAILGKQHL